MTKKNWISIGALVALVLVVLVIVVTVVNKKEDGAQPETQRQTSQPRPPAPRDSTAAAGVTLDAVGRQVFIPDNPGGDVLSTSTDDGGTCEDIRSPANVQIQRVHGAPVLFSTDSGPTRISNEIPVGYADGPRGALLAGINFMHLMRGGGDITTSVFLDHMVLDDQTRNRMESAQAPQRDNENRVGSPGFKVTSCTENAVGLQIAIDQVGDSKAPFDTPRWRAFSLLVVKDSGEWKLAFDDNTVRDLGLVRSQDGWTTWAY